MAFTFLKQSICSIGAASARLIHGDQNLNFHIGKITHLKKNTCLAP